MSATVNEDPEVPEYDADADAEDRIADLLAEHEASLKVIAADPALAEAWAEMQGLQRQLADLDRRYSAKTVEVAAMTREARLWKRKADALAKGKAMP